VAEFILTLKIDKMKSLKFLFALGAVFMLSASFTSASARGVRIPVGEREYASVVAELPDTDDYKTDEGNYIDLATIHTAFTVAYIPVYVTEEPRLIGYCEKEDVCYEMSDDVLAGILAENELDGEKLNKISFWHRFGGKLVFVVILAGIGYWYFGRKNKETEEETAEE